MRPTPLLACCTGLVLLAGMATRVARADRVILNDGQGVQGRVLKRVSGTVFLEVKRGAATLHVAYRDDEVREIIDEPLPEPADREPAAPDAFTAPAPSSPRAASRAPAAPSARDGSDPTDRPAGRTYLVAPIRDMIGLYATAELLERYLTIARIHKPDLFILDIDSPGGSVSETKKVLV